MRIETQILDIEYNEKTGMSYFGDYISLDAEKIVSASLQNIASHEDNEFFDGRVRFFVGGELFFEEITSDLCGLWISLISFEEYMNDHRVAEINSIDSMNNFHIIETATGYRMKYEDAHYTCNDEDIVIHREVFTVESKEIDKETFEQTIRNGFIEYRDFVVKHKLPISDQQLEELLKQDV